MSGCQLCTDEIVGTSSAGTPTRKEHQSSLRTSTCTGVRIVIPIFCMCFVTSLVLCEGSTPPIYISFVALIHLALRMPSGIHVVGKDSLLALACRSFLCFLLSFLYLLITFIFRIVRYNHFLSVPIFNLI